MAQFSDLGKELLLCSLETGEKPLCYDAPRERWITAAALRRDVEACAARLSFPHKALAFCLCNNSLDSLVAYLACWSAGHAVLLLDARLDASFRDRLSSIYRPEFLLAPRAIAGQPGFAAPAGAIPVSSEGPVVWRNEPNSDGPVHPDLAVLLSTSGSTGSPKLVRLSHRNIVANAWQIREALNIQPAERAITSLPLHYSYGLSVVNSHLAAGASLALTSEGILSRDFWTAFRNAGCTSLAAIPYMYEMLKRLDLDALAVPTLATMTQAGGKLQGDLIARFHSLMVQRGGRFFVMYGQTEATARMAVLPAECLPAKLGSAGKTIPGGSLAIEKDGSVITAPNSEGELVYSGPNVMMGYASCREDLAGGQVTDRLYTGDLGHCDADGFFYITGRNKRFAKVLGLRINLDDVETLLNCHGPTAVVGGCEQLMVYCEHGDDESFATYAQTLSRQLKLHPSVFTFRRIASLPVNSNGKPDYPRLATS